jgi:hypothetical protein
MWFLTTLEVPKPYLIIKNEFLSLIESKFRPVKSQDPATIEYLLNSGFMMEKFIKILSLSVLLDIPRKAIEKKISQRFQLPMIVIFSLLVVYYTVSKLIGLFKKLNSK